mmetsp:Transcript_114382/g.209437  ORF Transcript_114382/g.209437 Transcript_114382/m.209437 type:complete len:207 (+) Transcript_114382:928-1548(+)
MFYDTQGCLGNEASHFVQSLVAQAFIIRFRGLPEGPLSSLVHDCEATKKLLYTELWHTLVFRSALEEGVQQTVLLRLCQTHVDVAKCVMHFVHVHTTIPILVEEPHRLFQTRGRVQDAFIHGGDRLELERHVLVFRQHYGEAAQESFHIDLSRAVSQLPNIICFVPSPTARDHFFHHALPVLIVKGGEAIVLCDEVRPDLGFHLHN